MTILKKFIVFGHYDNSIPFVKPIVILQIYCPLYLLWKKIIHLCYIFIQNLFFTLKLLSRNFIDILHDNKLMARAGYHNISTVFKIISEFLSNTLALTKLKMWTKYKSFDWGNSFCKRVTLLFENQKVWFLWQRALVCPIKSLFLYETKYLSSISHFLNLLFL